MALHAWGDESVRMALDTPCYLLAASILDDSSDCRLDELNAIKPKGAKKLHWMDMSGRLKQKSISFLASLSISYTIVIASPLSGRKQERARRKCLETLLPYLESKNIPLLTLESRGEINDKRDIELLFTLRRKKSIEFIDVNHLRGTQDGRLWIPDQILGAYAEQELLPQANKSQQQGTWDKIAPTIERLRIEL